MRYLAGWQLCLVQASLQVIIYFQGSDEQLEKIV